jgi:hypothetical protein
MWITLGVGSLGAVLSASCVALEGDSGRPWIVNFMSLAAGTVGGYLCAASSWFLLLAIYVFLHMEKISKNRLKSVEHLDEDTLIS